MLRRCSGSCSGTTVGSVSSASTSSLSAGEASLFAGVEVDEVEVSRLGESEGSEEDSLPPGRDRQADPSAAGHDDVRLVAVESDAHERDLASGLHRHDCVAGSFGQEQLPLSDSRSGVVGLNAALDVALDVRAPPRVPQHPLSHLRKRINHFPHHKITPYSLPSSMQRWLSCQPHAARPKKLVIPSNARDLLFSLHFHHAPLSHQIPAHHYSIVTFPHTYRREIALRCTIYLLRDFASNPMSAIPPHVFI